MENSNDTQITEKSSEDVRNTQDNSNASTATVTHQDELPAAVQTPTVIRENLVATAIKFLDNPKVREKPFAQKLEFLERKGMTKTEVDLALLRSGTVDTSNKYDKIALPTTSPNLEAPAPYLPGPALYPVPISSTWSRIRDAANLVFLLSGAAYAIYHFYKKFIMPALSGEPKTSLVDVNRSVEELRRSMADVVTSINETQNLMKTQQRQLDDVVRVHNLHRGPEELDRLNVSEIRDELKSLKALLLNRKQFPALPTTTPVIPAWQLQQNTTEKTSSSDGTSTAMDGNTTSTDTDGTTMTTSSVANAIVNGGVSAVEVDENVTADDAMNLVKTTDEQSEIVENGENLNKNADVASMSNGCHDDTVEISSSESTSVEPSVIVG